MWRNFGRIAVFWRISAVFSGLDSALALAYCGGASFAPVTTHGGDTMTLKIFDPNDPNAPHMKRYLNTRYPNRISQVVGGLAYLFDWTSAPQGGSFWSSVSADLDDLDARLGSLSTVHVNAKTIKELATRYACAFSGMEAQKVIQPEWVRKDGITVHRWGTDRNGKLGLINEFSRLVRAEARTTPQTTPQTTEKRGEKRPVDFLKINRLVSGGM
jgi:hypothetical protein